MGETPTPENNKTRNFIGGTVLIGGVIIIVSIIIAIVVIGKSVSNTEALASTKEIFNALLPVIAAWIGTVIAFYFGKENFEAAGRQFNAIVNKITPEQFRSIPVKQVMIDIGTMTKYPNATNAITVADLASYFSGATERSRLPVVDAECKPLFIIHKEEYETLAKDEATRQQTLLSFNMYGANQPKGFVTISNSSTLNDAQQAVKRIASVKDVFITQDGSLDTALEGWLTDSRILNFLQ